jgi:hypothetical protein
MTPGPQNGFGVFFFLIFFQGGREGDFAGVFADFEVQNVVFAW